MNLTPFFYHVLDTDDRDRTIRAMISENSTRKTQARAFSFFAFTNNLGIFVGPLVGGFHPKEMFKLCADDEQAVRFRIPLSSILPSLERFSSSKTILTHFQRLPWVRSASLPSSSAHSSSTRFVTSYHVREALTNLTTDS